MWPAFAAFLVVGTALLRLLPFTGDRGAGLVPAFLVCGFLGLAVVAGGAPLAGLLLRRRDRSLPRVVADDRAGTALLAGLLVVMAIGGVLHRPAIVSEGSAAQQQAFAARNAVLAQAPPQFRRNVDRLDSVKQGPALYRACVPGPRDSESWCVLVTTDQHPPGITVDPDRRPNDVVAGPRNPGRLGGG